MSFGDSVHFQSQAMALAENMWKHEKRKVATIWWESERNGLIIEPSLKEAFQCFSKIPGQTRTKSFTNSLGCINSHLPAS